MSWRSLSVAALIAKESTIGFVKAAARIGCALALLALAGCGEDDTAPAATARPVTGPTLVAVGDIACAPGEPRTRLACHHADTAGVAARLDPDVVAPLGDLQYEVGARAAFAASYDPTWGRLSARTRPAIGNHEYGTPGAAGYFDYFGARAGRPGRAWYAYGLGSWRVLALDTNCGVVDCSARGAQARWLRAALAREPRRCTLAYGHHPRFSSGLHGPDRALAPLWRILARGGADVYLAGHDHHYERFAPQTAAGALDRRRGIVQFVVGTGGKSHYPTPFVQPHSRARATTFGVLELTLGRGRYAWRFAGEAGEPFRDAGAARCR
jgi:hypothetical protein